MMSIKGDIRALALFAEATGLDCARPAKEALIQLVKVTSGLLPTGTKFEEAPVAASSPSFSEARQRPRIGGAWGDELPTKELDLNAKLQDALDPETGLSVRGKWPSPELADSAIKRWFALRPTTPRLRYDERDGATVGFLEGFPYLFGYLGEEPPTPADQYRGFLGPSTYVFESGALVSQATATAVALSPADVERLIAALAERAIPDGEAFRISNYDDVVHLSDSGPVRIMTLNRSVL
jgi:hypothetical protein